MNDDAPRATHSFIIYLCEERSCKGTEREDGRPTEFRCAVLTYLWNYRLSSLQASQPRRLFDSQRSARELCSAKSFFIPFASKRKHPGECFRFIVLKICGFGCIKF